jgi:hypothetical protein
MAMSAVKANVLGDLGAPLRCQRLKAVDGKDRREIAEHSKGRER